LIGAAVDPSRWPALDSARVDPNAGKTLRRTAVLTSTSNTDYSESEAGEMLIPIIRAAATIGFAIAPCSLGFVIIAVSEHVIRTIMVGDDPESLMCKLQNRFPNEVIEVIENDETGLVAKVVASIEQGA
jgi:hypothetical protein